jgi:crossover junction endodeoxyribonuclease RuvC
MADFHHIPDGYLASRRWPESDAAASDRGAAAPADAFRLAFVHASCYARRGGGREGASAPGVAIPPRCCAFATGAAPDPAPERRLMRIIGVDPGLRRAGWGVVALDRGRLRHVANGVIASGAGDLPERLVRLHAGLADVIAAQRPDAAAIERTFVNADPSGALLLGQARGVALLALAQAGLTVAEYAPNEVKKAVVGVGHADKAQIALMVRRLLPGAEASAHDAWDALAIAIVRAHRHPVAGAPA